MNRSRRPGGYTRSFHASKMRPHEKRKALGLSRISTDKFISEAVVATPEAAYVVRHQFVDFPVDRRIHEAITARGFTTPTPIQDQTIAAALEGRDVIGLANTGTGKTAAFLVPIIQGFLTGKGGTALVVAPTRELATQIVEEYREFTRRLPELRVALCVGGVSEARQIEALRRRPQLVVGTPGRLKDFIDQGVLDLSQAKTLVLDEADRMVDMGFIRDIRYIIAKLPTVRQNLFFSATLPPEVQGLVHSLMRDPVTVSVVTRATAEGITQDVIRADSKEEKLEILLGLLKQPEFSKVLIFGRTKWGVQKLADSLTRAGVNSVAIHGNKTQPQRDRALKEFKEGRAQVLVATDVAARGIHIEKVSHVINFDVPQSYEDYIHRIGRTGRVDQVGVALTFVPKNA